MGKGNPNKVREHSGGAAVKMLRWSINSAGDEFSIDKNTLKKRLTALGLTPGKDGCWSTKEITTAIYGSLDFERTRKLRAEADKAELERAEKEGELVPLARLIDFVTDVGLTIRQRVLSLELPDNEKDDILAELKKVIDDRRITNSVQS